MSQTGKACGEPAHRSFEVHEINCSCGRRWRVSDENMTRLMALMESEEKTFIDINLVPDDLDWLGHVSDEELAAVARVMS